MTLFLFGFMLLIVVIELARRRRLVEEYALLWIAASLGLTALSFGPGLAVRLAGWIGVGGWPPAAIVAAGAAACGAALWISMIASGQRRQIERLTEETAILAAELRELRPPRAR